MIKMLLLCSLLLATEAYAHPADRFCPGEPYPPEYEQLGLVGFDPATATPAHCEPYIPSLCADDPEFVTLAIHYWHERRSLLDTTHRLSELRERVLAYANVYAARKKKTRPLVPTVDWEPIPDGYHTQSDFIDYWNRILRSPETQACARWRHEGEWTREKVFSFLEDHVEAAEYHKARAQERIEILKVFEPFFYALAIKR